MFLDNVTDTIASDIVQENHEWLSNQNEFFEKFIACAKTKAGREFILYLVGYDDMTTYLESVMDLSDIDCNIEDMEEDDA